MQPHLEKIVCKAVDQARFFTLQFLVRLSTTMPSMLLGSIHGSFESRVEMPIEQLDLGLVPCSVINLTRPCI